MEVQEIGKLESFEKKNYLMEVTVDHIFVKEFLFIFIFI
jgi:hypothetical protein